IQSGRVCFDGKDVGNLSFDQWRKLRGLRIATILQDPSTSLNPVLTIGVQFEESLQLAGPITREEARRRAVELMSLMAIRDPQSRLDQYPHHMSGGIRQRIVIAMAMIHNPDLIIADEPTTALDVTVQAQVLDALRIARERTNAAMLFITHDLALVAGIADRVAVMRAGRIVEQGDVFSIFARPQDPYTMRLLSLAPRLGAAAGAAPLRAKAEIARDGAPLLQGENLSRHFLRSRAQVKSGGDRVIHALCGVSFALHPGETLGIVGESGSGKTTLLNTILGLYRPSEGRVIFEGTDLSGADRATRKAASRHLSVVFQDPYSSLDPRMTVAELLEEPAQIHGLAGDRRQRVRTVLDRVRMPTTVLERFPHEFSGGQRQRIAIARALMLDPRLVVLDSRFPHSTCRSSKTSWNCWGSSSAIPACPICWWRTIWQWWPNSRIASASCMAARWWSWARRRRSFPPRGTPIPARCLRRCPFPTRCWNASAWPPSGSRRGPMPASACRPALSLLHEIHRLTRTQKWQSSVSTSAPA
ncbi:MAG TPA: ABC transporter ATP-binding protein, partial [Devosia sp.]|nr:ABC transporter ATP-binding protein [Devosia sp.]